MRLFCFPWAGVGAGVYRPWAGGIRADVEVCAIRPPGRESRLREPAYQDLLDLADAAGNAIVPLLDRPFAFFGHSLGSWLAFEVIRWLRREGHRTPVHLFVSGRRAPHIPARDTPMHQLPDYEFIMELRRRYGGVPDEVLNDRGLLELLLPSLRADVTSVETYNYSGDAPLACPISAFGGLKDEWVLPEDLQDWKSHTTGAFRRQMFPGDHFYVESDRSQLLHSVTADLAVAIQKAASTL